MSVPVLAWLAGRAVAHLPLAPLQALLSSLSCRIRRQHPGIIERLGPHAEAVIAIAPSDVPLLFRVQAAADPPVLVLRPRATVAAQARITAPLAALFSMLEGKLDGDAMFFARDITIEGDTSAILALRNALDAAEIDLSHEASGLLGPFAPLAEPPMRAARPVVARLWSIVHG